MDKKGKIQKGEYGYLKYRKTKSILHMLVLLMAGVGIFVLGLALNKWEVKNIFTVFAILMILPIVRVFVSLVILIPYRQISIENKNEIEKYKRSDDVLMFNLVFTSSEHVQHLDALLVTGHQAVGLILNPKEKPEKVNDYFKKEFAARKLDFVYFGATSINAFSQRLQKRSDNETLSEKQQADRNEVLEMIRTAIV